MYDTYRMLRIQLHLADEEDRRLRVLARETGQTRAALIRHGIELLLSGAAPQAEPLLDLIGAAGPAARHDIAQAHDEILYPSRRPTRASRPRRRRAPRR
jgi:hypothetical protein